MSCLTFGSNNLATNSATTYSIITGTENAQFPLSYISHPFTTKVFRSEGNTVEILIDTKTSTNKNMFAIAGSTIDGLGFTSISIYGSPSSDFTGSTEIVVDVNDTYNFGYKLFDDVSFRYFKLSLTGNGSYAEISNIFLGEQYGFSTNTFSIAGFEFFNKDNAKVSTNAYNQKFITRYNKIKSLNGSIDYINREEFDLLNYIYTEHGISTPIWFIYDQDDASAIDGQFVFSGYYYMTTTPTFKAIGGQLWNSSLSFEEAV